MAIYTLPMPRDCGTKASRDMEEKSISVKFIFCIKEYEIKLIKVVPIL